MKHARLTIFTIVFLLITAYISAAQTPKPETPPRRIAISLRDADPVSGNLVGADATTLLIEVDGKLTKFALDDVTMIIFAPTRAKTATLPPSGAEPPALVASESATSPATIAPEPNETVSPSTSTPTSTGGPVQVRGYYRKDGTYVRPHTRSAPRRKN
jgi:hypothetical protein